MWLKIIYDNDILEYEVFKPDLIKVQILTSKIAPIYKEDNSIRISRIFPLLSQGANIKTWNNYMIHFVSVENPFNVLGKIKTIDERSIVENVFFSYGECSLLLICKDEKQIELFETFLDGDFKSETWIVHNEYIHDIKLKGILSTVISRFSLPSYCVLPLNLTCLLDEYVALIKLLERKLTVRYSPLAEVLDKLHVIVSNFTLELIYLNYPSGDPPLSLITTDTTRLKDSLFKQILEQQIIDRIIQINSSLSYVSTQTFSGDIPILERRSLIRRTSLLGIGSAISALSNIINFIEKAFDTINFEDIITTKMKDFGKLNGIKDLTYNNRDWSKSNIDLLNSSATEGEVIKKLVYFSSRHAYRESEFSITASTNSLTHGISLEWPILTITHEMLHSHARTILNSIFFVDGQDEEKGYSEYYERFKNKYVRGKENDDGNLIDSIREIIFLYTTKTLGYGSISVSKDYNINTSEKSVDFYLKDKEVFYKTFENEHRNLHEIFVHVLDLHYFYGGRNYYYIPLIWSSWSVISHVNADLRQYILRSLLAISSKIDQDPYERWEIALNEFKRILNSQSIEFRKKPIIQKVLKELENPNEAKNKYFSAFKNSLIIVDLVMNIFFSKKILKVLHDDKLISYVDDDTSSEQRFVYDFPIDFNENGIACPVAFLFDRFIRILNKEIDIDDVERQTAKIFLALSSKYKY